MRKKSIHGNIVLATLISLTIIAAFITMFVSCSESLPPEEDGSSLPGPATAAGPATKDAPAYDPADVPADDRGDNPVDDRADDLTDDYADEPGDDPVNDPGDAAKQPGQPLENGTVGQESEQSPSIQRNEEAEPGPLALDGDLKLGELQVDMPKKTVEEFIKAKLLESKTDNSYGFESETLIYDDGTEIHLVDGKIYSVSVAAPGYPTPRGLRVGDTAEKVIELYGEPAAIEKDGLWVYSARGYDLFYITVENDIVAAIKVSQVM